LRFYNIAEGSLEETNYFLLFIKDLGYYETEDLREKVKEVGRMLKGYTSAIKKSLDA
jgi:four helix bundle protein